MLFLDQVDFAYTPCRPILRKLTMQVAPQEVVSLIGSSGSGKTTLFRLLAGLLKPIHGRMNSSYGQPTYMPQEDLLLPWRNVMENVLLLQELGTVKHSIDTDRVQEVLRFVGLEGYEHAYPQTLSGGQRQRVALARSLLQQRSLLLLDEPFGSLDIHIREQLYQLLLSIRSEFKKTIVIITHDFRDALAIADRVLFLKHGQIAENLHLPSLREAHTEWEILEQIRSLFKQ